MTSERRISDLPRILILLLSPGDFFYKHLRYFLLNFLYQFCSNKKTRILF